MEQENLSLVKRFELKCLLKANTNIILLFSFLVVATVLSPLLLKYSLISNAADSFLNIVLAIKNSSNYVNIFFFTLVAYLPFSVAAFICGISVGGFIFAPIFSALIGLCNGIYGAALCSRFSGTGFLYYLSIPLPAMLIATIGIILSLREAFVFSRMILRSFSASGKQYNFYFDFKLYGMRFVFSLVVLIISAAANTLLTFLFFNNYSL